MMRVLIVDDHEVVRKVVRSLLLRSGYDICGEAVDGEDAIEKAKQLRPDVILMDVSMPKLNGLEATRRLRSILPHSEVLILSQHESAEMLRQVFNAGARGYVAKTCIARDLLAAIEKVSQHEAFYSPAVAGVADRPEEGRSEQDPPERDRPEQGQLGHLDVHETLQRRAALDQALRESEEFNPTFDEAAVGICHVGLDGHFLRVNRMLCDSLGYSQEELLQLTNMSITHPEDLSSDVDTANALVEGTRDSYQIEKRYLRKDGTTMWGELTVGLLRDQRGNPRHFVSVVVNMDDRKGDRVAPPDPETRSRIMADSARSWCGACMWAK